MLLNEIFFDINDLEKALIESDCADRFPMYKVMFFNEEMLIRKSGMEKPYVGFYVQKEGERRLLYMTKPGTRDDVIEYAKKSMADDQARIFVFRLNIAEELYVHDSYNA